MNHNAIYDVFEEDKEILYAGRHATFGIVVCQENAGQEIARVSDVSTDRSAVERLARQLNRMGVSPVHFMEILEDFWGTDVF